LIALLFDSVEGRKNEYVNKTESKKEYKIKPEERGRGKQKKEPLKGIGKITSNK
jgi:hypothetical protein